MANVEAMVREGIAAVRTNRRDEARRILIRATDLEPRNEEAWLWLSACVDSLEEQRICLENVLSINPHNEKARRGLDVLNKRSPAPPPPSVGPFSDSSPDTSPYAGTGFDSNLYGTNQNDPAIGAGWGGYDAEPAESTTSSVEWGSPDRAPAPGSGKDVPQPSSAEYDQWMQDLQIGGSSANPEPTSGFDPSFDPLSGPFSPSESTFNDNGAEFDTEYSPFNTSAFGGSGSPNQPASFEVSIPTTSTPAFGDFGAPPFDNSPNTPADTPDDSAVGAGDFENDDIDLFAPASQPPVITDRYNGRSSAPPAKTGSLPRSPDNVIPSPLEKRSPSRPYDDSDLFDGSEASGEPAPARTSGGSSPFGEAADIFHQYRADRAPAEQPVGGPGTSFNFGNKNTGTSSYFASIPSDIPVEGGAKPNLRLMVTIGVLGLLNTISLGALVLNLLNR